MPNSEIFNEIKCLAVLISLQRESTVLLSMHIFSDISSVFKFPDSALPSKLSSNNFNASSSMLVDYTERLRRVLYVLK